MLLRFLIARIAPRAVKTQVVELIALNQIVHCVDHIPGAKSPTFASLKIALLMDVRLTNVLLEVLIQHAIILVSVRLRANLELETAIKLIAAKQIAPSVQPSQIVKLAQHAQIKYAQALLVRHQLVQVVLEFVLRLALTLLVLVPTVLNHNVLLALHRRIHHLASQLQLARS